MAKRQPSMRGVAKTAAGLQRWSARARKALADYPFAARVFQALGVRESAFPWVPTVIIAGAFRNRRRVCGRCCNCCTHLPVTR